MMRLDCRDPACPRGLFIDLATGRPLRWVVWVDLQDDPRLESEFEAFREEPNAALARGILPAALRYRGKARLRFVRAAPVFGPKPSDPRDLVGSLEEARRRFVRARPVLIIPGLKVPECDERFCHRPAYWAVSDEQEVMPEVDAQGRKCERAVTVRPRFYCDRHYRPPTFVNLRGVQSEVKIEEARPQ
jgi:hypothetical protein